jgi:heme-degrading monooxygenase HmoA
MTVIKINAITVPADSGEEVARRFAARAGSVDGHDGFEGFELLRPTDDRTTWLVVTRWRDEASFDAWVASPAFAHGHQGVSGGGAAGEGHPGAPAGGPPGAAAGGHPGAGGGHGSGGPPMGLSAELWSYEPVVGSPGNQ